MTTGTSGCGPNGQQVTSWTIRLEQNYARPAGSNGDMFVKKNMWECNMFVLAVTTTGGQFNGGTLTVPR